MMDPMTYYMTFASSVLLGFFIGVGFFLFLIIVLKCEDWGEC